MAEQEQQCRAWAEKLGYEVRTAYHDAGYSGMSMERPALQQMLIALITSTTPCAVIVTDRARLTRNLKDWPTILGNFDDLKTELLVAEELAQAA